MKRERSGSPRVLCPRLTRGAPPSLALRATLTAAIAIAAILGGLLSCNRGVEDVAEGDVSKPSAAPETGAVSEQDAGIYDDRIIFGQSAALSGPAQALGRNMKLGIEAAFFEANAAGGIHGRLLELTSKDDAYEPEAAIANTLGLIEERVFALIGAVGTPTSRSATPIAAEAQVPYIAPFTGAEFLRDAGWGNILNLRASYYQETEEMVARLTEDLGIERIAVMYQDDSFGRAGYNGVRLALERRSMEMAAIGLYTRNTTAVKSALLDVRQGDPEAVIMIGAYKPVAALIAWARHIGMDPIFMTVSFVGSNALAQELGPAGEGVLVTQVVPFPTDKAVPIVAEYQEALDTYVESGACERASADSGLDPEGSCSKVPGFVSLEGYLAGRLAVAGLDRCGREVSRACFLGILNSPDEVNITGFKLQYGEDDNQGSDAVFLTMIGSDGNYRSVDRLSAE